MRAIKTTGRSGNQQSRILQVFTGQAKQWSCVDYAGCLSGPELSGSIAPRLAGRTNARAGNSEIDSGPPDC